MVSISSTCWNCSGRVGRRENGNWFISVQLKHPPSVRLKANTPQRMQTIEKKKSAQRYLFLLFIFNSQKKSSSSLYLQLSGKLVSHTAEATASEEDCVNNEMIICTQLAGRHGWLCWEEQVGALAPPRDARHSRQRKEGRQVPGFAVGARHLASLTGCRCDARIPLVYCGASRGLASPSTWPSDCTHMQYESS